MKTIATLICLVLCSLSQAQQVSYTAAVTAIGTNTRLTALRVGQSFDLVLSVQDLRPSGTWNGTKLVRIGNELVSVTKDWQLESGVFAAYCDVRFDRELAKVTYYSGGGPAEYLGCFTFSARYPNGPKASFATDRINDVGAFATAFTGNSTPVEVWRVRMTSKNPGALVFSPTVDQVPHPACDTLVYGNIAADPPEQSYVAPGEVVLIPCAVTVSP